MANVIKVPAKTETKVVVVEPEKYVLEMTAREAMLVQTLVANTQDANFAEVKHIYRALRDAGIEYYGKFTIDKTKVSSITLIEVYRSQRSTGTNEEWA